jgi:hypothetical protein
LGKQEKLDSDSRMLWVMLLHQQAHGMQTINESKKVNGLSFSIVHIAQREKKLVSTFQMMSFRRPLVMQG